MDKEKLLDFNPGVESLNQIFTIGTSQNIKGDEFYFLPYVSYKTAE